MSLIEYIEKLQQKPRHIRLQIMWASSILGVAVIFIFWLWSLTSLLAKSPVRENGNDKALQSLNEIKQEVPGLLQSLTAGIGNVIDTAQEELIASPSATPSGDPASQPGTEKLPIE